MNVYQIEITNKCNYTCNYCPRQYMKRPLGKITKKIINTVSDIIDNKTIRIHHFGESLIYPDLVYYTIRILKEKNINCILNTNGSLLNNLIVKKMFNFGLKEIFLSYHNENSLRYIDKIDSKFRNKITILKICNIKDIDLYKEKMLILKNKGYNIELKKIRDLGQIQKNIKNNNVHCSFLDNNEVVVLYDGTIVPCCECYDDNFILGNVYDFKKINNTFFEYCKTCHGYGNENIETERIML